MLAVGEGIACVDVFCGVHYSLLLMLYFWTIDPVEMQPIWRTEQYYFYMRIDLNSQKRKFLCFFLQICCIPMMCKGSISAYSSCIFYYYWANQALARPDVLGKCFFFG